MNEESKSVRISALDVLKFYSLFRSLEIADAESHLSDQEIPQVT